LTVEAVVEILGVIWIQEKGLFINFTRVNFLRGNYPYGTHTILWVKNAPELFALAFSGQSWWRFAVSVYTF